MPTECKVENIIQSELSEGMCEARGNAALAKGFITDAGGDAAGLLLLVRCVLECGVW